MQGMTRDLLHKQLLLKAGDIVEVHVSHPGIILVMEGAEFERYRQGESHRCRHGGYILRYHRPVLQHRYIVIDAGRFIPDLHQ